MVRVRVMSNMACRSVAMMRGHTELLVFESTVDTLPHTYVTLCSNKLATVRLI